MRLLYLVLCLVGTVVPYLYFIRFLTQHGLDIPLMIELMFSNSISAFFVADLLISFVVFLVFLYKEATKHRIKEAWICVLALFTVGLSLAFPLFLFFRHGYLKKSAPTA